jgi:hypothetical protein
MANVSKVVQRDVEDLSYLEAAIRLGSITL